MKKIVMVVFAMVSVYAHTPIMSCIDEGDETITCEGGFSDGSGAGGVEFRVEQDGKTVLKEKLNSQSEINFKKPEGGFVAVFDAGPQHEVFINSKDIVE